MKLPARQPHLVRSVTAALVGLLVLLLLGNAVTGPDYPENWDLERLGQLPIQEGGRIKPVDTLARSTLMILSGRQSWQDREGKKHTALEWFTELVLDPRAAAARPVFRIDHPDIVGLLGFHNEERKYFSLSEIAPHFQSLREQFGEIPEEPRLRNPFESGLAKLQNALGLYDRVAYSFVPPPLFGDATTTYNVLLRAHADAIAADPGSEAHSAPGNALRMFENQFRQLANSSNVQAIPPAPEGDPEEWHPLGASLLDTVDTGKLDPVVAAFADLSTAWQAKDTRAFSTALDDLENRYNERTGERAEKTGFEYFFNTFAPFGLSMQLYIVLFIVAAFSWLGWPRTLAKTALAVMAVAFLIHTFGLGARVYIQERPPVTNLYSSAIFVSWAAVPLCLLLEKRYLNGIASAAAAVLGFTTLIIAHYLSFSGDTLEMMQAVLDSNFWLATHVPTVTLGYSATFLAGLIAAIYLIRTRLFSDVDRDTEKAAGGMVYGSLCFALLFSFVGTVLGGVWADQSWGRFWGWDPKENGALMIVLWNALILHARWAKIAGTTGIMQLAIVGNIITAWSWFGTNMLGVGLHSYGFMDSAFFWLVAFVLLQVALILLGYRRARSA
ncbi:MAG: cytochrome C biogenesis protein [Verrucomicrobia bacterium]|jgi:ABC-type transport system involved in cytochrome c biogenesis permease subunit|nr:cytochrome C biogenesis protein [Verrucomicrobiota bacterium]